jgi:hypothetical protein
MNNENPTYKELEYQISELKRQKGTILLKSVIQNQEKSMYPNC